jgi:hypothetical protein
MADFTGPGVAIKAGETARTPHHRRTKFTSGLPHLLWIRRSPAAVLLRFATRKGENSKTPSSADGSTCISTATANELHSITCSACIAEFHQVRKRTARDNSSPEVSQEVTASPLPLMRSNRPNMATKRVDGSTIVVRCHPNCVKRPIIPPCPCPSRSSDYRLIILRPICWNE